MIQVLLDLDHHDLAWPDAQAPPGQIRSETIGRLLVDALGDGRALQAHLMCAEVGALA